MGEPAAPEPQCHIGAVKRPVTATTGQWARREWGEAAGNCTAWVRGRELGSGYFAVCVCWGELGSVGEKDENDEDGIRVKSPSVAYPAVFVTDLLLGAITTAVGFSSARSNDNFDCKIMYNPIVVFVAS